MDACVASARAESGRGVFRFSGAAIAAVPPDDLLFLEDNSAGNYARLRRKSPAVLLFRADSCRFRETRRHHQVKPRRIADGRAAAGISVSRRGVSVTVAFAHISHQAG